MSEKEIKTFKDLPKLIIFTIGSIFSAMLCFSYIHLNLILEQIISLCASIIFLFLTIKNANLFTINKTGITIWRLLGKKQFIAWNEIKEVGVLGTRVFPKTEKNNGGRKYIYFSSKELTEDDRFDLALKWPPRIPYTFYTKEKVKFIAAISEKNIIYYNAKSN